MNELEMTEPCRDVASKLFNPTRNPYIPAGMKAASYVLSPVRKASAAEMLERINPRIRIMFGLELGWKERLLNTTTGYMQWVTSPFTPAWTSQYVADYYMGMLRKGMRERKIF